MRRSPKGFSALHRGQGPAGWLETLCAVADVLGFSALHRGQGPAGGPAPGPGRRHDPQHQVSVPSIAGRVLRGRSGRRRPGTGLRCFSAIHRGQGPAGPIFDAYIEALSAVHNALFQCPPSRAGSCGSSSTSSRLWRPRSFSALHRGQGPAGGVGRHLIRRRA